MRRLADLPADANARDRWRALPGRERRAVARHAKRGEHHPDPRIAAVAQQWAASPLSPRPSPTQRTARWSIAFEAAWTARGGFPSPNDVEEALRHLREVQIAEDLRRLEGIDPVRP